MRTSVAGRPRLGWHPLVGAALLAVPCAVVALGVFGWHGAGGVSAGITAFLTMGAVAGFSVSGST